MTDAGEWPRVLLVCPDCGKTRGTDWHCSFQICAGTDRTAGVERAPDEWREVAVVPLAVYEPDSLDVAER